MITGKYDVRICDSANTSSVIAFIATINSTAAEANAWKMKYFGAASVLYMFLMFDIKRMNEKDKRSSAT